MIESFKRLILKYTKVIGSMLNKSYITVCNNVSYGEVALLSIKNKVWLLSETMFFELSHIKLLKMYLKHSLSVKTIFKCN